MIFIEFIISELAFSNKLIIKVSTDMPLGLNEDNKESRILFYFKKTD